MWLMDEDTIKEATCMSWAEAGVLCNILCNCCTASLGKGVDCNMWPHVLMGAPAGTRPPCLPG
jgi:hypothetical protein